MALKKRGEPSYLRAKRCQLECPIPLIPLKRRGRRMMWIRFLRATSDILDLPITDILLDKVEPISVNNRGHLGLPKDDLRIVKTLMVVLYSIFFYSFYLFLLKKAGRRGECSLSNLL